MSVLGFIYSMCAYVCVRVCGYFCLRYGLGELYDCVEECLCVFSMFK